MNTFDSWNSELRHYGMLGMRWGVRKYQNPDGSLTPAGKERYEKSGTADSIFLRTSSRTTRGLKYRLKRDDERAAKGKERKYDTKKLKDALKKSEAFDKKVQKRVTSQSTVKTIAQTLLMGSRGALRYQQLRTMGQGRLISLGGAYVDQVLRGSGYNLLANGINSIAASDNYAKKRK